MKSKKSDHTLLYYVVLDHVSMVQTYYFRIRKVGSMSRGLKHEAESVSARTLPSSHQTMSLVRYFGWYNSRARGMRRNSAAEDSPGIIEGAPEHVDPELSCAAKAAWARLIEKVYEIDPKPCPRCGGWR